MPGQQIDAVALSVVASDSVVLDTADFETAAGLCSRASAMVSSLPARLCAGAHDTHAARLDGALDVFARQAGVAADALRARIGGVAVLLTLAAHGFTSVELALAQAMSP